MQFCLFHHLLCILDKNDRFFTKWGIKFTVLFFFQKSNILFCVPHFSIFFLQLILPFILYDLQFCCLSFFTYIFLTFLLIFFLFFISFVLIFISSLFFLYSFSFRFPVFFHSFSFVHSSFFVCFYFLYLFRYLFTFFLNVDMFFLYFS